MHLNTFFLSQICFLRELFRQTWKNARKAKQLKLNLWVAEIWSLNLRIICCCANINGPKLLFILKSKIEVEKLFTTMHSHSKKQTETRRKIKCTKHSTRVKWFSNLTYWFQHQFKSVGQDSHDLRWSATGGAW